MLKREFKVNLKSFIIWISILVGMFLFVYAIYPSIVNDESIKSLDEMMNGFPPEILKAFNMDMASLTSAYGWLKSEGFMFIMIIVGIYSSIMGSNIVLKEESDKTIEYLACLPIKRKKIVTNKIIVSIIYIFLMIFILGIFNYVSLLFSGEFNHTEYLLLSISPLFIALPLFSINLFISMFLHNNKKTIGFSLGLVFIFYLINVISELSDAVSFLKYFSVYTLADIRGILSNVEINPICIILSFVITVIFIVFSYIKYNKKELV